MFLDKPLIQRLYQLLPLLVTVLLILLLAFTSSRLIWQFLAPPQDSALVTAAPSAALSVGTAPQTDHAARVASAGLFGKAQTAKTEEVKPVDAPETRLNLKLSGIYASEDEEEGFALISSGSGREKLYRVGDKLPGNSELSSVFPDRVILKRSGKYETLRMPETKNTGGSISRGSRNANARPSAPRKLGANSAVAKLRQEVLKNPAKLGQFVNAVPARENGQFIGFRIVAKRKHPAFDELDIKSGDIVTRVNGIDIDSPQKGFQVLQKLRNATQVSVTIKRNGQLIQVSHSL